jgi:two-component system, cell cycle response regulator DivK
MLNGTAQNMAITHQNSLVEAPLVLVVDDYDDGREMCAEYLAFSGFRVAQARDGFQALEQALTLRPSVILMDLSLPGIDGWEVTRRLKGHHATRHIPVVALTAHALASDAQRAQEAGCDSFVTKPCLPDSLVLEIRRLLGLTALDRDV